MKEKIFGGVAFLTATCFLAHGVTYMHVEKNNGTVDSYDVEEVTKVTYDETKPEKTTKPLPSLGSSRIPQISATVSGNQDGYDYVDLGLPSGVLWATYNLGASQPTDYGDYYAWGETSTKKSYELDNYKWMIAETEMVTKYCINSRFGEVDGKEELDKEDEAVIAHWGGNWRMPTNEEMVELCNACSWEWTSDFNGSGVAGRIGTSKKNGNVIFLPAAGQYADSDKLGDEGKKGYYLSSSLCPTSNDQASCIYSWDLFMDKNVATFRYYGSSIRPVIGKKYVADDVTVSGQVGKYDYVDLGLPSGLKWATLNIGAKSVTDLGSGFAWGETETKETDTWSTYKWCNVVDEKKEMVVITKYSSDDKKTLLSSEDDAATANMGKEWRMPTAEECNEMIVGCSWKWIDNFKGTKVSGFLGVSKKNGNAIFIPTTTSGDMNLWASTCTPKKCSVGFPDYKDPAEGAELLCIYEKRIDLWHYYKYRSFPVRGVSGDDSKFTVDFYTENGVLIERKAVSKGAAATGVYPPEKLGYLGSWKDSSFMSVTENLKIYAKYEPIESKDGATVSGFYGDYSFVDLGLSVRWATYNVGATKATEKGSYFAWGETKTKSTYNMTTYKWGDAEKNEVTKYCINADFGTVDSKEILELGDDAARANWGGEWRMPTDKELQELYNGCTWEWSADFNGSGVAGHVGTSKKNGNIIFLPAAGQYEGSKLSGDGECGYYLSSSLKNSSNSHASCLFAWKKMFDYNMAAKRELGSSVRAVVEKPIEHGTSISGRIGDYTYVDLGLPSGVKWATYNIGATNPCEYGMHYAWGELTPKNYYYQSSVEDVEKIRMKACNFVKKLENEGKTNLAYEFWDESLLTPSEDVATVVWGSEWRMPTAYEFNELVEGCTWSFKANYNNSGISGYLGSSMVNGNTIFFPAAGFSSEDQVYGVGELGFYWASTLVAVATYVGFVEQFFFCKNVDRPNMTKGSCFHEGLPWLGQSIRAVSK
ncbi:MAG: hypothetical protein IKV67_09945 [Paludibacteraceae bacterium]|nr:hypothetical protein [Paludibacteraceae bacterium]